MTGGGALFRFVVVVLVVAGCGAPSARYTVRADDMPEVTREVDKRQCDDAARSASNGEHGEAWRQWGDEVHHPVIAPLTRLLTLPVPVLRSIFADKTESAAYKACMEARGYALD